MWELGRVGADLENAEVGMVDVELVENEALIGIHPKGDLHNKDCNDVDYDEIGRHQPGQSLQSPVTEGSCGAEDSITANLQHRGVLTYILLCANQRSGALQACRDHQLPLLSPPL